MRRVFPVLVVLLAWTASADAHGLLIPKDVNLAPLLMVSLSVTCVAQRDRDLIEYVYPLKTDGKATQTLEDFSIKATIKSQHAVQNVYSPTHALNVTRTNDREVNILFEKDQALLDKDFQL